MVKGSAGGRPNLLALGVQRWDPKAISIYGEPRKFLAVHPSKQARWTPIVPIAQNRSSVRLHCRIVHKHPLLLLTAVSRPLLAIPPRSPVAGASCARKFRVDIRTSYRPPEGLPARRSAGPRGGCGVLCLLHVLCVLYDRGQSLSSQQAL